MIVLSYSGLFFLDFRIVTDLPKISLFFLDFRIVTDLPKILYVVNLACVASSSYSLHEVALVSCHELGDPVHVSVNKSVT
ncbi:hypothetical protein Q3G72_006795 [Acer saccharum]|nr:hypothetical protein Q3G72_006795 [Acer saccharum]